MTNLAARVRRFVARRQLWTPGARVAAAVSGGGDSVAMFRLLGELAAAGDIALAGVVHLNHQLRPTADRDERFCLDLAAAAGLPIDVTQIDVAAAAAAAGTSIEVAARRARYHCFDAARGRLGADVVAVAHTRDDQAETVVMRLLRGTGTRGLRGAWPARRGVVRPLLECGREELRGYLRDAGARWEEDETNADTSALRNRIRHDLLPHLAGRYQPAIVRTLARTATLAWDDEAYLAATARVAFAEAVRTDQGGVRLSTPGVLGLAPAIGRRVVALTLERAGATRAVRSSDIERVLALCRDAQAAPCRVAGIAVERFSTDVVLFNGRPQPARQPLPPRQLDVPGVLELPECGPDWRLRAAGPIQRERAPAPAALRAVLDAAAVRCPFTVRGRRAGDRMRPVGLGGSKSLQDLFVDRKVPRGSRDRTPVVLDAGGRIVWVAGVAVAEGAGAVAGTVDVVVLNFERPDGSGPEAT